MLRSSAKCSLDSMRQAREGRQTHSPQSQGSHQEAGLLERTLQHVSHARCCSPFSRSLSCSRGRLQDAAKIPHRQATENRRSHSAGVDEAQSAAVFLAAVPRRLLLLRIPMVGDASLPLRSGSITCRLLTDHGGRPVVARGILDPLVGAHLVARRQSGRSPYARTWSPTPIAAIATPPPAVATSVLVVKLCNHGQRGGSVCCDRRRRGSTLSCVKATETRIVF